MAKRGPPKGLFKRTIEQDFFRMFCGERLGSGVGREVYVYARDDKYVVKLENIAQSFQNVLEWDTWCDASYREHDIKKWFAPCDSISDCGTVLIQRRTKPLKKLPEKMPTFFTDFKTDNYGLIGGQVVAHDYGITLANNAGLNRRMRKIAWKDDCGNTIG